ncbi:MAG: hypothetical protein LBQ12_05625 [Deltaproteobacteria bacterium]|jgi:hypothetical protein|nr:hypothetical protein [Deltaproteobacteria bacterium]
MSNISEAQRFLREIDESFAKGVAALHAMADEILHEARLLRESRDGRQ